VEGLVQLCRVKPIGNDAITYLAEWLLRNNPNKPKVSEPVVEQAEVGVLEQIEAKSGEAPSVVWALGGPGSNRDESVEFIAEKFGHEVIDIVQLLQTSANSGSEYGELIKDHQSKSKEIPTYVTVNLVRDAMLSSGQPKFIIKGFPRTLDEAVHFEQVIGSPSSIVYFDCTDATKAERIKANGGEEKANAENNAFKAGVYPIVDAYHQFGKVKKISTDGAVSQVQRRVERVFR
jgi:adenylate kinase family enzyme